MMSKMSTHFQKKKKIKNLKKYKKSLFFQKSLEKNLNIYFLNMPLSQFCHWISIRPEVSSPPRFRIQGGQSEIDGGQTEDGRKSLCLIFEYLIQSVILFLKASKLQYTQTVRAREQRFWENVHPPPCVTCHLSPVRYHMSGVTCHM